MYTMFGFELKCRYKRHKGFILHSSLIRAPPGLWQQRGQAIDLELERRASALLAFAYTVANQALKRANMVINIGRF